jgi:hypothetical protein
LIDDDVWPGLILALAATGRDTEWTLFVQEVVSTQLTGRLTTAGRSIADDLGGRAFVSTLQFEQRMRDLIQETTRHGLAKKERDRAYDLTARAVLATYGTVTDADDRIIRREAGRLPHCFLCNRQLVMIQGDAVRDLSDDDRELAVEYEHVWPRSYGGNTFPDNLALACHGCNQRKASFANWAMVDAQSLILGWNPSDITLSKVPGWRRFALTSWKAHYLAERDSLTLKQAHRQLTRSVLSRPKVLRVVDSVDFFNLVNHGGSD